MPLFILMSGDAIRRVGAMRFAGLAGTFSCVFMLTHSFASRPAAEILKLPAPVFVDGVILALLGTVAPTLLLALGLRRTTPQRFAIIGAIGPVGQRCCLHGRCSASGPCRAGAGLRPHARRRLAVSLMKSESKPSRTSEIPCGAAAANRNRKKRVRFMRRL